MPERDELSNRYLYPSGRPRIACPTDNDGFPTCTGDGELCAYSHGLKQLVCARTPIADEVTGTLPEEMRDAGIRIEFDVIDDAASADQAD